MKRIVREFGRGLIGQLRSLLRLRRYRVMLLLLLGLSVVGMDIYQRMIVQQIPVALVDLDNSRLSRTLRTYLASEREVQLVGDWISSPEQARQLLIEGRVAAVVLLPRSLSEDVKKGRKGEVVVGVDASNILRGKTVYKAIAKAAGTVGAGVQLTTVSKLGERNDKAIARVVPLAVEENLSFNPSANYALYIAPGLVFFLLHVFVLLLAASLFLPGQCPGATRKVGAATAIVAVGLALGLLFFYVLLPREAIVPKSSLGVVVLLLGAFLSADVLLASGLSLAIPNRLLALEVVLILGMLSLMLSGITWPRDLFPRPLAAVAEAIPFTHFARALRKILHYPCTLRDLGTGFCALGVQALAFGSLALVGATARTLLSARKTRASCGIG